MTSQHWSGKGRLLRSVQPVQGLGLRTMMVAQRGYRRVGCSHEMMLGRAPWARRTATASVVLYGQRSSSYSSSSEDLDGAAARIARARRVVAFTGAGLSAESGIPTYRAALEAQGRGLWDGFRGAMALAFFGTKIGWLVAPSYAWALYVDRLLGPISRAEPNAAHAALADLDACLAAGVPVITQNVDGLCQRAGARDVIEVHGTVLTYIKLG